MVGLAGFLTVGSEVGRGNIAVPVDANGSCLALASSGEGKRKPWCLPSSQLPHTAIGIDQKGDWGFFPDSSRSRCRSGLVLLSQRLQQLCRCFFLACAHSRKVLPTSLGASSRPLHELPRRDPCLHNRTCKTMYYLQLKVLLKTPSSTPMLASSFGTS